MNIYAGDIGTEIILDCGVDLSGVTEAKIILRHAKTGSVEKAATTDGNCVKYIIEASDLSEPGTYHIQAYVSMDGWSGKGSISSFNVEAGL
jgi:hypothetical protein